MDAAPSTPISVCVIQVSSENDQQVISQLQTLVSRLSAESVPICGYGEADTALQAAVVSSTWRNISSTAPDGRQVPLAVAQFEALTEQLRCLLDAFAVEAASVLVVNARPDSSAHAAAVACGCRVLPASDTLPLATASLQEIAKSHRRALNVAHNNSHRLATSHTKPDQNGGAKEPLLVGYVMKASREAALVQQGMLPLLPVEGMGFMPLDAAHSLDTQGPVDAILHKVTDELGPSTSGRVPDFLPAAAELERYAAAHPRMCVVDPIADVRTVLDRRLMLAVLQEMETAVGGKAGVKIRGPRFITVDKLDPGSTSVALAASGMWLPVIAKPVVACGVPDAHSMAFVLAPDGFEDLDVPLPACVQEYVDHGGVLHKVYVAGDEVLVVQRPSTPDLGPLAGLLARQPDAGPSSAILFNSLHSLPRSLPWSRDVEEAGRPGPLRFEAVQVAAAFLRRRLRLSLFGFDVVVQVGSGTHVVVDINYFPSFKGVSNAPELLRQTIRQVVSQHTAQS